MPGFGAQELDKALGSLRVVFGDVGVDLLQICPGALCDGEPHHTLGLGLLLAQKLGEDFIAVIDPASVYVLKASVNIPEKRLTL